MLGNKPPYTTMQQLNLDWVLSKLKTLLRLVPDDGAVGQILRRTRDGAVWSDEQGGGGGGAVQSVNGKTGAVVLDAADVGALPNDYTPPVTSVNGETGAVVLVKSDVGLPNVDNVKQYSATNPPPYPVTSVNGQTGAVVIQTGGSPLDAYPIGSIYMSVNSTSPATLFGGTWERLENRFLLGAGSDYVAGATGGEAEHTLVKAELPAEQYRVGQDMSALGVQETWYLTYANGPTPAANAGAKIHNSSTGAWAMTEPLGSGQAHNNMPPYLAVYMWKRTA